MGVEVVGESRAHLDHELVRLRRRTGLRCRRPRPPPGQSVLGAGQHVLRPVTVFAVVGLVQAQPDRRRVMALGGQVGDEDEVAQRLAHLDPGQADHAGVDVLPGHPVAVVGGFGVGGGELVVREAQVTATALDGEGRPQAVGGDRRALHVPAGTSRPEG